MIFRQLFDPQSSTYTYLLACPATREAVLVDPVFEHERRDAALIQELGFRLLWTLETHVHADHVTGAALLRRSLGSKAALSRDSGATGADRTLVDTAGRLQTRAPLMDELRKIAKVCDRAIAGAPHETVLVLDANTGQNAIQQAKLFSEVAPLTGLVLTKLDGTAKGGAVLGIADEVKVPIYFIGIGEAVEDLRAFEVSEFVEALF